MEHSFNSMRMGLRDGFPVALGYISISFAFGLMSTSYGLTVYEAVLISMFNLTSAGQLAALPIIASGGTLAELALTQLLINLRYSLMSISLAQRFDKDVRTVDRFYLSLALTDEIFAVSIDKNAKLDKKYLLSLIILPYIGWTLGTLLGAVAGNILPEIIAMSLSISMYAMFIAILVPASKASLPIALTVLLSIGASCLFENVHILKSVPTGFTIIICSVAVSILMALLFPLEKLKESEENE